MTNHFDSLFSLCHASGGSAVSIEKAVREICPNSGGSSVIFQAVREAYQHSGGSSALFEASLLEKLGRGDGGRKFLVAVSLLTTLQTTLAPTVMAFTTPVSTSVDGTSDGNVDGAQFISSGGILTSATIVVSGKQYVFSNGSTIGNIVSSGGSQTLYDGGITSATTLSTGGRQYVSSGGTATSTTVSAGGAQRVYAGGSASDTTVAGGGGFQTVFDSGIASATTVFAGGFQDVSSGGSAVATTLSSGGNQYVSAGGIAISAIVSSGGRQEVLSDGTANATTVSSGGNQYVFAGGIAAATTVAASGRQYVSGGIASNTTVAADGFQYVLSGGSANDTTISAGGFQTVFSGGVASATTVSSGGFQDVSAGGSAAAAILSAGGNQYVRSDGIAAATTVFADGRQEVLAGGTANDTTISAGGNQIVSAGGIAAAAILSVGGNQYVSSGGTAISTTVASGGNQYVEAGGSAVNVIQEVGGNIITTVGSGAFAATVISGNHASASGSAFSLSNGSATHFILYSGGFQHVSAGGIATSTTIFAGGFQTVFDGGVASATTVSSGGFQDVSSGGIAAAATLFAGGNQYVLADGIAAATTVFAGGRQEVLSGGIANDTTVSSGGVLYAAHSTAMIGGSSFVADGGIITGSALTLDSGGSLTIERSGSDLLTIQFFGDGKLIKTGDGSLTLYDNFSDYTGSYSPDAGTLKLFKNDDLVFSNMLGAGTGTLAFDLGSLNNKLTFDFDDDSSIFVDSPFMGTIELINAKLDLNDDYVETVLTAATLQLSASSEAYLIGDVNTPTDVTIHGLRFNGGTLSLLAFDDDDLDPNNLLVTTLDAAGSSVSTVKIDFSRISPIRINVPDDDDVARLNFFDYASLASNYQEYLVKATTVADDAQGQQLSLELIDENGNPALETEQVRDIHDASTNNVVGKAKFDYVATIIGDETSPPGLYLGFGLKEIESYANNSVTLDSSSANASVPLLSAKLTGAGSFVFSGSKDAKVGNTGSDYSGATIVDTLTLTANNIDNIFGHTSSLSLVNGAAVDFQKNSQTVGALNGEAGTSLLLGLGSVLSVGVTGDTLRDGHGVFEGTISGDGSLLKSGSGTLILSGNNSCGGGTTISEGTLQIGNGGVTGSVTGNINNDAALIFNRSDAITYSGISGSGSLTQSGSGVLTLDYVTYTGATIISAGTLRAGIENAIAASSSVTVDSGATFSMGGYDQTVTKLTNNGLVDFVNLGRTLTVTDLLDGNGTVRMDVNIAGDLGNSDKIVVGDVTGTHRLLLTNLGAAPTGKESPLMVAQKTGYSESMYTFTGGLDVGASRYLVLNGLAAGMNEANNWYLVYSGCSSICADSVGGQRVNAETGFLQLANLGQRVGEHRNLPLEPQSWARTYRSQGSEDGKRGFFGYDQDTTGVQIGRELLAHATGNGGTIRAALSFDYAETKADFDDQARHRLDESRKLRAGRLFHPHSSERRVCQCGRPGRQTP
ncbi:MAG: AIDA repeat-containing protein [Candidatus Accumulibacter sp.]|jgi:autotransporter passenger strand-loop-strand repeat protein/autotransporter-associated beta strand protein|nr:AIDA repeat-containing protein [Accumulibacter sp.]